MTASEPPDLQHASRSKAAHRGSFFKRALEWFWLAEALRREQRAQLQCGEREQRLAARARSCAEIARQVAALPVHAEDQTQAIANELYRHAAYFAVLALSPSARPTVGTGYSEAVWHVLDEVLPELEYGKALSPSLMSTLQQGSFAYFSELSAEAQGAVGSELRPLVEALLSRAESPKRRLLKLYLRRVWHVLLLVALLLVALPSGLWLYHWRPDLAAARPWRASSTLGAAVCVSPAQECELPLGLFFHTAEELNPWLEVDLGSTRRVSKVELVNRADCCADRAVPITVELSTDHQRWRVVARRDAEFSDWSASFAPAEARWVRLRVLKQTYFHLKRVRIF